MSKPKEELTPLQQELKKYLNEDNIKWSKTYSLASDKFVRELIEKYRSREERKKELEDLALKNQQEEPEEKEIYAPGCSPLMQDSGGGWRVIRSTRGL